MENWYYRILILLTGNLKNAEIAVDALSVWYVAFRILIVAEQFSIKFSR